MTYLQITVMTKIVFFVSITVTNMFELFANKYVKIVLQVKDLSYRRARICMKTRCKENKNNEL
jgi:hypothetical protein